MKLSQFIQLIITKILFNLKSEASKSYLSYLWWVAEPALFVIVMYLVFGVFLARGDAGFVAFLVCGNIPFLWFSKSIVNSGNSIVNGRGLISQVRINKVFFPVVVIGQDLVKQVLVFCLLVVFLYFYGISLSWGWLYIIFIGLVQFSLILACALFVSAMIPLFPDFKFLVSTGIQLLMFGSGIFYSYEDVLLPEHRGLFLMNPIAVLINNYRFVLLDDIPPQFTVLMVILLISSCVAVAMIAYFSKLDGKYSRLVIE